MLLIVAAARLNKESDEHERGLSAAFHFMLSAPLGRAAVTGVENVVQDALAQRGVATMAAARAHQ
jgi:hypothetical protein